MSFFCQSGTEAVEAALKLARYVSGRGRFIGFLGGFHGRTMGSLSFTSSKYTQQKGFFPTMPGVTHVPYPNRYRPLFAGNDQGAAVLNYIEKVLFTSNVPPSEVAAILIEPMQGEGGYLVPPDGFLQGLRELCDRHGILLIFDEVQSGIGRTGKMFAAEHCGVVPDIMTLAKGLGSGLPIGMAVAKQAADGAAGSAARTATRTAAIRCAARRRSRRSTSCRPSTARTPRASANTSSASCASCRTRYACIGEVRGKGLMIGMELVEDRTTKVPATKLDRAADPQRYQNGMLLLSCGVSTIRFMPPLMIDEAHVDEAITILDASLGETQNA